MSTLINETRSVISAEDDDYYEDDVILEYLNYSQLEIVSTLVNIELDAKRSLRVIDGLRQEKTLPVTNTDNFRGFTVGEVASPASLYQLLHLEYDGIPLRELTGKRKYLLTQANLIPSTFEGYFVTVDEGFTVYMHTNSSNVDSQFIARPTALSESDEKMMELPDQLTKSLIYGAAYLMSVQEKNEASELFDKIYKESLNGAIV